MGLVRTSAPAVEPVSLAEVKEHLKIDDTTDDILIAGLIRSARERIEQLAGLVLVSQDWVLTVDQWPSCGALEIPLWPVQSVAAITVYDRADVGTLLDPAGYDVSFSGRPARIVLPSATPWPQPGRRLDGIEVAIVAGFGSSAADVPEALRLAVTTTAAHWYGERGCETAGQLPGSIAALLAGFREVRL